MAIGANSYGTVAGVEALVRRFTDGGTFKTTTVPTLVQVEGFIDQVSGVVNTILEGQGVSIPVTEANSKLALDMFVNEEAAALVEASQGQGRLMSEDARATGAFKTIMADAEEFILRHAAGLEKLGATRTRDRITAWMETQPLSSA